MTIALEEIESTSREAAREAAAQEAGKTAYYKALVEGQQETIREQALEIRRLEKRCRTLSFFGIGSTLVLGTGWTVEKWGIFE